jgi:hypothetical protein
MSVRECGSGPSAASHHRVRVLTALVVVVLVSGWTVPAAAPTVAERATSDQFEPNDTPGNATSIDPGTYETPVLSPDDRDVYAVELDRGEELSATVDGGTATLRLLDPSGDTAAERAVAGNGTLAVTASKAGIYYVDVRGVENDTVDYTLSVGVTPDDGTGDGTEQEAFEPNDDFRGAARIDPGDYDELRVDPADRDVFAVALDAGERLRARIGFAHAEGDLDLAMYGPARLQQGNSVSTTDNEVVSVTAETNGTYYVEVYGYQGATAAYDLSISTTQTSRQVGPDRFEPNDAFTGATPVDAGEYDDPRIVDGESDYYVVQLERHDRLTAAIDFDHVRGDLDLALYGPDRQELDASISTSDGERVAITADRSGTYYLEVYGYRNAASPYDLSVATERVENDALEPNDRRATATAIANRGLSESEPLRIVDGEDDYFAVPLERGQHLTVTATFEHEAGDLDLELYGPRGVRWDGSYSVTDNETAGMTAPVRGTYYVRVSGFQGAGAAYTLNTMITGSPDTETTNGTRAATSPAADRRQVSATDEGPLALAAITRRPDGDGNLTVTYTLANNGTRSRAVILQSGLRGLPWAVTDRTDGNATWRSAERTWLFSDVPPGENVTTSVTVTLPENATGRHLQTRAITTEHQATAPVTVTVEPTSVADAVDRDGDGTVTTAELQAAVEWWDRGEPVPGSGGLVISEEEMLQLLAEWQSSSDA